MTDTPVCKLEQKRARGTWPRSCPICHWSKTCARGLEEVELPNGRFEIRTAHERAPACEMCRFWVPGTNPFGECRRRAPVAREPNTGPGRATNYTHVASRFPETVRQDWCGEYEPRAKGEQP